MSVTRFIVVNVAGDIVQTLERLGAAMSETWDELQANVDRNAGPGHTVIRMCEHADCILIDTALARWTRTGLEAIPIVASDEAKAEYRAEAERGGLSGADVDIYVDQKVAYVEGAPARHLARVHLFGEGP